MLFVNKANTLKKDCCFFIIEYGELFFDSNCSLFLLFYIDRNSHFCYVLGNDFARNRPIYDTLSLQDGNKLATDGLTCGKSTKKGAKNDKNPPYGVHHTFFNHADWPRERTGNFSMLILK